MPRRTNGLLIALATIVLTIKISTSSEACMVEHLLPTNCLLRMLITFFFCSNLLGIVPSSFDLKGVYSVNNTLARTVVLVRLKCVISLAYYLRWCVVKIAISVFRYFFHALFLTLFTPVYTCRCLAFCRFFHYTIVFKFTLH